MRNSILIIAAAVLAIPAAPAAADPPRHAPAHGYRDNHHGREQARIYDDRGRYLEPRRVSRGDDVWQGRDNRYYCRRDNGTTGLIIGAAGGAIIGREVDNRGSRTVGTILGAAIGGLLGREIDRGGARCR
jgi:hypothetical protein